jgi:hypothetical protein
MRTNFIIIAKEREVKVKIRILLIVALILLDFIIPGCNVEKTQPIEMVAVPQLELLSDRSIGKDSSQKIQISLESFYNYFKTFPERD